MARKAARPRAGDLAEYGRKRDFDRTSEPAGDRASSPTGDLFVVQKHRASRLHFDFRLELDGVLKSWAVPKGPSLDPADKRLAMHVEDHPVAYGDFEGVIPKGEYGGGTVMLWDRGSWHPDGDAATAYARGELKFELRGEKLRGRWALVRMKRADDGDPWLLIKERDDEARPAAEARRLLKTGRSVVSDRDLEAIAADRDRVWRSERAAAAPTKPAARRDDHEGGPPPLEELLDPDGARRRAQPALPLPQLATLVSAAPEGDAWLHEIKFDGYRILAVLRGGQARLYSRNGKDWTARFARIARALGGLGVDATLDGEVVALDGRGISDFQALQGALDGGDGRALDYYAFDLLWCAGRDLTGARLIDRKAALAALLADLPAGIRYSDHVLGDGATMVERACELGLEGIVSKRADAVYAARRTRTWVKTKCLRRQEFLVGGWTDAKGSRAGFGALLLGYRRGEDLVYAGKVGSGFDEETLRGLRSLLDARARKTPPFVDPPRGAEARGVHWVRPDLVVEVEFFEWTKEGALRHPTFKGRRLDKDPEEIVRETERPAARAAAARKKGGRTRAAPAADGAAVTIAGVRLSSPDKVLYPEAGVTKRDLARYHEAMAAHVLRHAADRPLTLVRCPEGRARSCFYQKHATEGLPGDVLQVDVAESDGERKPYIRVANLAGLIGLVQVGALELHPWGSRVDRIESPDLVVFDLDPGPGVAWPALAAGARRVRERLDELGLASFVKTSGKKGLHVLAPLMRRHDWDEVKAFAAAVARGLEEEDPAVWVARAAKASRRGRIFVDWLRNARGATHVAAYSTRAAPGATVSTPLRWDELDDVDPAALDIVTVPRRLATLKREPWADMDGLRQSITKPMRAELGLA